MSGIAAPEFQFRPDTFENLPIPRWEDEFVGGRLFSENHGFKIRRYAKARRDGDKIARPAESGVRKDKRSARVAGFPITRFEPLKVLLKRLPEHYRNNMIRFFRNLSAGGFAYKNAIRFRRYSQRDFSIMAPPSVRRVGIGMCRFHKENGRLKRPITPVSVADSDRFLDGGNKYLSVAEFTAAPRPR